MILRQSILLEPSNLNRVKCPLDYFISSLKAKTVGLHMERVDSGTPLLVNTNHFQMSGFMQEKGSECFFVLKSGLIKNI